jgi:hypothetical protein
MPGLVPGIHVVTGHDGFRTSTFSAAAAGAVVLELALNVPAWMPGTSPGTTDTVLINHRKVLS